MSADLEKNGGEKCSTGQRFISCTEVTSYKIHILVTPDRFEIDVLMTLLIVMI